MTVKHPYRTSYIRPAFRALTAIALLAGAPSVSAASSEGKSVFSHTFQQANGSRELRNALDRLSGNPSDIDALIDAGNAALLLDDPDGAVGFFARAEQIDPRNSRVKAGLASALLGNENPYEALRLFDEAIQLGMVESSIAADRGLAYDLVGDNINAQRSYEIALRRGGGDEVLRRYALSLGITGDEKQAERLLDALLRRNDVAAWRTRAFIHAINGERKEAREIAIGTMPPHSANAIQPFLDYMPKLTKSQQAAAAHFGHFPKTANIGRPDPRNSQYASASGARRNGGRADAGLIPTGEPLGASVQAQPSPNTAPDRKSRRQAERNGRANAIRSGGTRLSQRAQAATPSALPSAVTTTQSVRPQTAIREATLQADETNARVAPNTQRSSDSSAQTAAVTDGASNAVDVQSAANVSANDVVSANSAPMAQPLPPPAAETVQSVPVTQSAMAQTQGIQTTVESESRQKVPGFAVLGNTANVGTNTATAQTSVDDFNLAVNTAPSSDRLAGAPTGYIPSVAAPAGRTSAPAASSPGTSFAALMSDIAVPVEELKRDSAAVDISKITPAKPKAKPKPEPVKPVAAEHPARYWAQISIGNEVSALPSEWRRLSRKAPDAFKGQEGWTAPMGRTNRVLAGPFESNKAAQEFVNELAKSNMDGFAWKSDEGEEIVKLPKK